MKRHMAGHVAILPGNCPMTGSYHKHCAMRPACVGLAKAYPNYLWFMSTVLRHYCGCNNYNYCVECHSYHETWCHSC